MIHLLEILCAFLISMSFIFLSIQIRAKFDRSFLVFGVSNLLICMFCAIDIWIQPQGQILHWTRLQHMLASFFPPFLVWHIMLINRKENLAIVKSLFLVSIIFSVLFLTNWMLRPSQHEVISTSLYNLSFVPYVLIIMVSLFYMVIANLRNATGFQKRVLKFHLIGLILLCLSGLFDLLIVFEGNRFLWSFVSWSILGTLGFSFTTTLIFTEKLATIVREREINFRKLSTAYKQLEEVQTLKELGQSTAIINHEIRNYSMAISCYSEILSKNDSLDAQSKEIVQKISECIMRLNAFSKDILEFSKSKILKDKTPLDVCSLIKKCIRIHFQKYGDSFSYEGFTSAEDIIINGDWNKLEQVFVNVFKNAFEAGAGRISVKISQSESVVLCIVEDDGSGCTEEQLSEIFKSFYTTKKKSGGTGLGMCVVKSVIEGHGGHVSAYTKNIVPDHQGLSIHMTFPRYKELSQDNRNTDKKQNIILIKEGIEGLSSLIRVFQNVMVNPHIVQSWTDIDQQLYDLRKMTILASPNSVNRFKKKFGNITRAYAIVKGKSNSLHILDENGNDYPSLFCEDYLLTKFVFAPKKEMS